MSLIYGYRNVIGKTITNEVGGYADIAYVVKQASAKVIKFTSAPKAALSLAA
jgi:PKD repeat protein